MWILLIIVVQKWIKLAFHYIHQGECSELVEIKAGFLDLNWLVKLVLSDRFA